MNFILFFNLTYSVSSFIGSSSDGSDNLTHKADMGSANYVSKFEHKLSPFKRTIQGYVVFLF